MSNPANRSSSATIRIASTMPQESLFIFHRIEPNRRQELEELASAGRQHGRAQSRKNVSRAKAGWVSGGASDMSPWNSGLTRAAASIRPGHIMSNCDSSSFLARMSF